MPESRWPDHPEARAVIAENWAEPFGDRRQEIVFVGAGMDRDRISGALDAALAGTEAGVDMAAARRMTDPFPQWRRA